MTRFHLRAKPRCDEVAVAIGRDGKTATVTLPAHGRDTPEPRDLRLSTALHFAGAAADQLGTDVAILDDADDGIFYIEDVSHARN